MAFVSCRGTLFNERLFQVNGRDFQNQSHSNIDWNVGNSVHKTFKIWRIARDFVILVGKEKMVGEDYWEWMN